MVKSYSKHWPCLFPQHGPGRKHLRKIELEQWQSVIVRKYPSEFARGLFHSDGWRGVNRVRRRLAGGDRRYEYPRYMFCNESADILRLCGEILDLLGVAWRYSRRNVISVARREAVARLDEFVRPKYCVLCKVRVMQWTPLWLLAAHLHRSLALVPKACTHESVLHNAH
jgi:hypothetical protein